MRHKRASVVVVERGAGHPGFPNANDGERVVLKQRAAESARDFTQRVASSLSELHAGGTHVERASLELSASRSPLATARRFSLARAVLAQLPDSEELSLGGPLGNTAPGRLDLAALVETLGAHLIGSRISVRAVPGQALPHAATNNELASLPRAA